MPPVLPFGKRASWRVTFDNPPPNLIDPRRSSRCALLRDRATRKQTGAIEGVQRADEAIRLRAVTNLPPSYRPRSAKAPTEHPPPVPTNLQFRRDPRTP